MRVRSSVRWNFFSRCHDIMTSFPSGRCCLGVDCRAPEHQLRKHCPGCDGWIHMLCGRCLIEDEGEFKEDSVVCPKCDPKQRSSGLQNPPRPQRKAHQAACAAIQAASPASRQRNMRKEPKSPLQDSIEWLMQQRLSPTPIEDVMQWLQQRQVQQQSQQQQFQTPMQTQIQQQQVQTQIQQAPIQTQIQQQQVQMPIQ